MLAIHRLLSCIMPTDVSDVTCLLCLPSLSLAVSSLVFVVPGFVGCASARGPACGSVFRFSFFVFLFVFVRRVLPLSLSFSFSPFPFSPSMSVVSFLDPGVWLCFLDQASHFRL